MIGFAAALVGEVQTGGKGPLGQLALPIHTPIGSQLAGGLARHVSWQDKLLQYWLHTAPPLHSL